MPRLAPYLEPLGVELQQLESARIDLLRSIQLRNVQLTWRDSELGEVEFTAERFQATYDLPALMSNQLEVNQVLLENARISARLRTPPASQPEPSEEPLDLQQVSELLGTPPMPMLIKAITINNVNLDLLIDLSDDTVQRSASYQGVLQQAAMEVIWQANQFKGKLQTTLGQNDQSKLSVSQTYQDQSLEMELAPATSTQAAWELSAESGQWNLANAVVEHHTTIKPLALYERTGEGKRQVGSLTAIELHVNGKVNSVAEKSIAQAATNDLSSVFPVAVTANLTSTVEDLKLDNVKQADAQISAQADHRSQFKLDGEVDPLQRVFKDFQMQAAQELTVANLDASIGGQRTEIKDLSLQLNAQSKASGDAAKTLPLDFVVNLDGQAQQVALHEVSTQIKTQTKMQPQFQLTASGQLQPFADVLQALSLEFQPNIVMQDVAVRLEEGGQSQEYFIARQQLTGAGKFAEGALSVDSDLNLEQIAIGKKSKRFNLKSHIALMTDAELTHPQVSLESFLDEQALLAVKLDADNQSQQLKVQHTLQLNLPDQLQAYYPAAEGLDLIGRAQFNASGKVQLSHGTESVLSADFDAVGQWPIDLNGEFTVTQLKPPKAKDGLVIEKPATLTYTLAKEEQYRLAVQANAPGVMIAPLQAPVPLKVGLQSRFTWPLSATTVSGKIHVQETEAVQFEFNINDQPRHARIDSHGFIKMDPQWQQYMEELKDLELMGQLASEWQMNADVKHAHNSLTELDPQRLENVKATVNLETELQQLHTSSATTVRLSKPVKVSQHLDWSPATIAWQSRFSLAAAQLDRQASIVDLAGNVRVDASPGEVPTKASLSLRLDEAGVRLMQSDSAESGTENSYEIGQLVTPLDLQVSAAIENETLILQDLNLDVSQGLLAIATTGNASLDGQNAQLESSINVAMRPRLLSQPAVSGSGSMGFPRLLTIKEGDQITVDGEMQFTNLDLLTDDFKVQGFNGSLNLNEELLVTPEQQIQFRYLVQADPFQRVDFSRMQPYLDDPSLRIENITIGDKSLGPALASMSLKQNLLRLPRFDLDLFGGHLSGQFYFDASPGAWKIALLGRLSQLDPRQLLPEEAASETGKHSPLNARIAVEFDLDQRLVEGRIDLTEISREQLLQLLDVIDPDHRDEQLAQVRTALRVAYPKWVTLDMGQGLLDLAVSISTLPKPIKVHGLPLTPLIQYFAGDMLDELGELPLQ